MKLVSLNTWGATRGQIFFDYVKEQARSADIFCFQEIFSAPGSAPKISSGAYMRLFEELEKILPKHAGKFLERSSGYDFKGPVDFPVKHGLAIFYKKHLGLVSDASAAIGVSTGIDDPVEGVLKAQVLTLAAAGREFSVINYHGPSVPGDKLDTPERIENSKKLQAVAESLKGRPKILCGDFNLMPETASIRMFEEAGMKNLIKEYSVTTTRNEISWERYHNKQSFADYTFVTSQIKVNSFEVPYNLVSDHLPMILEFEIC